MGFPNYGLDFHHLYAYTHTYTHTRNLKYASLGREDGGGGGQPSLVFKSVHPVSLDSFASNFQSQDESRNPGFFLGTSIVVGSPPFCLTGYRGRLSYVMSHFSCLVSHFSSLMFRMSRTSRLVSPCLVPSRPVSFRFFCTCPDLILIDFWPSKGQLITAQETEPLPPSPPLRNTIRRSFKAGQ